MTEKHKTSRASSGEARETSRGRNMYDRIAEARARRKDALAEVPSKRKRTNSVEIARMVSDSQSPDPENVADDGEPSGVQQPTSDEKPRRSVSLWAIAASIALAILAGATWMSRPAGSDLGDLLAIFDGRPTGPIIGEPIGNLAVPEVPADQVASLPPAGLPATRVVFDPMPRAPQPDNPSGATDLGSTEVAALAPESLRPLRDVQVMLNAPRTVPEDEFLEVVDALTEGGLAPDARRVNLNISRSNVRYFHAEDEPTARLISEAIGADLRDFTDFQPKPETALVEIWLSGRQVGGTTRRTESGPLNQLSEDLRRLQRGLRRALSGN